MSSLNFLGWRNLSARIPFSYSKDKYNPWGASIKLKRFVMRTHPKERVDNYMMYMNDIKVETIKDYTPHTMWVNSLIHVVLMEYGQTAIRLVS